MLGGPNNQSRKIFKKKWLNECVNAGNASESIESFNDDNQVGIMRKDKQKHRKKERKKENVKVESKKVRKKGNEKAWK